MAILNPWNIALVYIIGAEIIHLFQIKFTPDLLLVDHREEELKEKYKLGDIYPFLLIEIFYLLALFYLLFSPFKILWFYSIFLLTLGLVKIYIHRKIKNRFKFIKIDSTFVILLTLLILLAINKYTNWGPGRLQFISVSTIFTNLVGILQSKTHDEIIFQQSGTLKELFLSNDKYHHLWILLYRWAYQILTWESGGNLKIEVSIIGNNTESTPDIKSPETSGKLLKITYACSASTEKSRIKAHIKLPPRLMALHLDALMGKISRHRGEITLLFPLFIFK